MDLTGVSAYEKFEDLLADPAVHLVDLCVPNADHAPLAIAAMKAGKDVLVEIGSETGVAPRRRGVGPEVVCVLGVLAGEPERLATVGIQRDGGHIE